MASPKTRSNSLTVSSVSEVTVKKHEGQADVSAVFNTVMTAVGVGMLALAKATAKTGWVPGFILMVVCGTIGWCMVYLLYRCRVWAMHLGAQSVPTYEDIGEKAFGSVGRIVVGVSLHVSLIGTSCVLMLLLGQNSYHIYDGISVEAWVGIWTVLMMPLNWLKTMREIGYMSSTLGVLSIIVVIIGVSAGGFSQAAANSDTIEYMTHTTDPIVLLGAYTTFSFAYSVTCCTTTISHDMKNPTHSPKVYGLAFVCLVTVYATVSLAGYLGWGQDLLCYGNVLDAMPADFWGYTSFVGIIVLCATHYAVLLHPSCRALEYLSGLDEGSPRAEKLGYWPTMFITSGMRSLLVLVTAVVAVSVPNFSLQVDLLSAVTYTFVHLIFPPVFYMRLKAMAAKGGSTSGNFGTRKATTRTVVLCALMVLALVGSVLTVYKTVAGEEVHPRCEGIADSFGPPVIMESGSYSVSEVNAS